MDEQMDGCFTLSFTMKIDDLKWIEDELVIVITDQLINC